MTPDPTPRRLATLSLSLFLVGATASADPNRLAAPLFVPPAFHDGGGWTASRPDGHAPIGVMGDHVHHAGEWMFSYRYMRMYMRGLRDGSSGLSEAQVLADYLVTPNEMTMEMHMLGAMYAASDDWTLMAMVPLLQLSMDHRNRMGVIFTTESEGLGDIGLSALHTFWRSGQHQAHLNLGLSLPTGSIDETDDNPLTPGQQEAQLPYPMQLGSGTFDFKPGVTYLGQDDHLSWGGQAMLTLRSGENSNDYRLGNREEATVWLARELTESTSVSFRLNWAHWADIHGADPNIARVAMGTPIVPTAEPGLRNGSRIDALVGANLYVREGPVAGHRLAFELGLPLHEQLDGPQLETDWILTLGWQLAL